MNNIIEAKVLSSLEKVFIDDNLSKKKEINTISRFKNQEISFQIALCLKTERRSSVKVRPKLSGSLKKYAKLNLVSYIPVTNPVSKIAPDNNYLRTAPGLYPDPITPIHYKGLIPLLTDKLISVWVNIDKGLVGNGTLNISFMSEDGTEELVKKTITIKTSEKELPKQTLVHTEWFYTDCIAEAHKVKVFSKKHWDLIEKYLKVAYRNGISMILTPIFTPELDTAIGGERLTTQLLDIKQNRNGTYSFDLTNLKKWIDLCHKIGIENFEMPHFFTQWGANHAPKIIVEVNGKKIKKFGWDTDSLGKEYASFLKSLLTCLTKFFEKENLQNHVWFHISDEPVMKDLEHYPKVKNLVAPYVKGYPIIDALSHFEFYETGAIETPVPSIHAIEPFLNAKIPGLWAYYCGDSTGANVTGRQVAMPLSRTRILGVQLYKYNIVGFLHWGYNFYHNRFSMDYVDPFFTTDGEGFAPSGDQYLVYPGTDNNPWESIRLNALREAMEDMRSLQLYESKFGRENTLKMLNEVAKMEITFTNYPNDNKFFDRLRNRIIKEV